MGKIDVGELKTARERIQRLMWTVSHLQDHGTPEHIQEKREEDLAMLEGMVDQIDVLRPVGPDGKHGDRHTDECGCDDVLRCKHCDALIGREDSSLGGYSYWTHKGKDGDHGYCRTYLSAKDLNQGYYTTEPNVATPKE